MTSTTRTTTLSGGLLLLALGAPLLLAVPAAHAVGPLPVPTVPPAVAGAVEPVTAPVLEAAAPVVAPAVAAAEEAAPAPVKEAAAPVTEPVKQQLPESEPESEPEPRPTSSRRPLAPPVLGDPTGGGAPVAPEADGAAPVRPASGTSPSPVARPAAQADGVTDAVTGGTGVAAVDPARISGGLVAGDVAGTGGTGVAVAPVTAGMPAFSAVPGTAPVVPLAAPLAAPPSGLLPTGPARPTDLPAALVVLAAVAVAAVGTGQVTEVVSRRKALATR